MNTIEIIQDNLHQALKHNYELENENRILRDINANLKNKVKNLEESEYKINIDKIMEIITGVKMTKYILNLIAFTITLTTILALFYLSVYVILILRVLN